MTVLRISLEQYCGWAPGINDGSDWQRILTDDWQADGQVDGKVDGKVSLDLSFIPAMQRRRLSPLARAVFHVARSCTAGITDYASVFSSVDAEIKRTKGILQDIADGELLSPAAFSLSVHNAVAGQLSITEGNHALSITVAAGNEGIGSAFVEACGLLMEEQAERVLVVCFEEGLPEPYSQFADSPPAVLAAAFLLSKSPDALQLNVERTVKDSSIQDRAVNNGLLKTLPFWRQICELLSFLHANDATLTLGGDTAVWCWRRVDGKG